MSPASNTSSMRAQTGSGRETNSNQSHASTTERRSSSRRSPNYSQATSRSRRTNGTGHTSNSNTGTMQSTTSYDSTSSYGQHSTAQYQPSQTPFYSTTYTEEPFQYPAQIAEEELMGGQATTQTPQNGYLPHYGTVRSPPTYGQQAYAQQPYYPPQAPQVNSPTSITEWWNASPDLNERLHLGLPRYNTPEEEHAARQRWLASGEPRQNE